MSVAPSSVPASQQAASEAVFRHSPQRANAATTMPNRYQLPCTQTEKPISAMVAAARASESLSGRRVQSWSTLTVDDQHDDERAAEQQTHERVGRGDAGDGQRGEQRFGAFAPDEQREPEERKGTATESETSVSASQPNARWAAERSACQPGCSSPP